MARTDRVLERLRKICLALPDTRETLTWGSPHFRVGDKIFCGYGEEKGSLTIGFKLEMAHAELVVGQPGFRRAPYVGHKGWVSLDASTVKDWKLVQSMILESFSLIAPKRTLARLEGAGPATATRKTARKRAPRKRG